MSLSEILNLIEETLDCDKLSPNSIFDNIHQGHAKIGRYWFPFDCRLPWQLGQSISSIKKRPYVIKLRLDVLNHVHENSYTEPLRKAHWWGPKFDWTKIDIYRQELNTVHGNPGNTIRVIS